MSLIWTHHALDRLKDRKLARDLVESTFAHPDEKKAGKQRGTSEFIRHFGRQTVTLIAKQNERGEWIAVSCWIDPPFVGTRDDRQRQAWKRYQHAPWWQKLLLGLGKQLRYLFLGNS
ncbi:hypothetical protein C5B42_03190 [Candidatus Cerribacteria bacterium 'Amazon FNV 2010 28 9']|uniref:DUF4258 domain-containing protein n=1 Tax=Candidatus Cerribacteria bacterium 'Amazon FNV 2010 28 9' TaxID=2081795 RepID=A0A317JNR2_9BACT|nr:MAG: hypothetical protein C5B42_03190 [Candidatus Cerribacteria bacterium 'Amazon FNV 2010 28 9']